MPILSHTDGLNQARIDELAGHRLGPARVNWDRLWRPISSAKPALRAPGNRRRGAVSSNRQDRERLQLLQRMRGAR